MYLYACLVEDKEKIGHVILATAPSSVCIKENELIVLEGEGNKIRKTIAEGCYMDDKSEEFQMLLKATGNEKPARIYGKYRFNEFKWEDKEDE